MKSLRLFLVNVGFRTIDFPLVTPPMGILYLAAYLRTKFNLSIQIINQREENYSCDEVIRRAVFFSADIVGFGCMTSSAYLLEKLTDGIRIFLPKALIVLGGPHISAIGAKTLEKTKADIAVSGEGELTFENIINAYLNNAGFDKIPNIFWRNKDNIIVENPVKISLIEDLDKLPFPAYDLLDIRKYWKLQSIPPIPRRKYISLTSSRGCPYNCIYCHAIFGKRFRSHSAQRIVDEIKYYIKTFEINDIEFLDDIFNFDRRRLLEFNDLINKNNIKIKIAFPSGLRADILDQECVDALSDAGTYFSAMALESGSPRVQKIIGKNLNIPKFLNAVKMVTRRGIFTYGFNMLGFPTETEDDMKKTIDVACSSDLHSAAFFTVTPYPKTKLYDLVMKSHPERLEQLKYDNHNLNRIKINCCDIPDKVLFSYHRRAFRQFYMNPVRIYRLLRDFPQVHLLPLFFPIFLSRSLKGIFQRS
ncbi:MAG: B12-binding domain-containing radical SAM protein [Spirochaetes bacterium]|nr:B12-binding domain-containing radical SAM protein [Spirochaetota bacterium]